MLIGSLEPPLVKIVELRSPSLCHDTAVAPVVSEVVEQSVCVTWWQTLSQSSTACGYGGGGFVGAEAAPSSSKLAVSCTAFAPDTARTPAASAAATTPTNLA